MAQKWIISGCPFINMGSLQPVSPLVHHAFTGAPVDVPLMELPATSEPGLLPEPPRCYPERFREPGLVPTATLSPTLLAT